MASSVQSLGKANEIVDTLVKTIERNFRGFNISEIVKGGSLGHGTPVFSKYDVDLVVYSREISREEIRRCRGYKQWLEQLQRFLAQTFSDIIPKVKGRSVQFTFREIDVDLLVSPYWEDQHQLHKYLKSIPADDRQLFTVCASKWQVQFFKQQPNEVKEYIRKAKQWRNEKWPAESDGSGRPSSYLMSLLVVAAYYQQNSGNVTQAIKYLVKQNPNLYWDKFYDINDYPLPRGPKLMDPANPFNDVWHSGIKSYTRGEKPSDYEPGDGNSTVLKRFIDTINLN